MLTGKQLGEAIKQAIKLKIDSGAVASKADIARHFGIKAPSIYDWINKGSISKDKLPELWRYFSDVVGMDHWGLQGAAARMAAETGVMPDEIKEPSALAGDYPVLTPELIPPRKVPVEGTAQLGDDGYWSRLEGNTDGAVLSTLSSPDDLDFSRLIRYVEARLSGLAAQILKRFPQPQDLFNLMDT